MDLMHSTPKKTLLKIEQADSFFVAKLKKNQKGLLAFAKEIEACSSIDSSFSSEIKQSNDTVQREVFVCSNCIYLYGGISIASVIRVDKSVNDGDIQTHYYISNETNDAETFLKKILQEWSVETMHFYKDTALLEDKCKINKGAFSLSILRSFVINILHLNQVRNIGRQIRKNAYDLSEALMLFSMVKLEYGFLNNY
jgi:hypothetical protein